MICRRRAQHDVTVSHELNSNLNKISRDFLRETRQDQRRFFRLQIAIILVSLVGTVGGLRLGYNTLAKQETNFSQSRCDAQLRDIRTQQSDDVKSSIVLATRVGDHLHQLLRNGQQTGRLRNVTELANGSDLRRLLLEYDAAFSKVYVSSPRKVSVWAYRLLVVGKESINQMTVMRRNSNAFSLPAVAAFTRLYSNLLDRYMKIAYKAFFTVRESACPKKKTGSSPTTRPTLSQDPRSGEPPGITVSEGTAGSDNLDLLGFGATLDEWERNRHHGVVAPRGSSNSSWGKFVNGRPHYQFVLGAPRVVLYVQNIPPNTSYSDARVAVLSEFPEETQWRMKFSSPRRCAKHSGWRIPRS